MDTESSWGTRLGREELLSGAMIDRSTYRSLRTRRRPEEDRAARCGNYEAGPISHRDDPRVRGVDGIASTARRRPHRAILGGATRRDPPERSNDEIVDQISTPVSLIYMFIFTSFIAPRAMKSGSRKSRGGLVDVFFFFLVLESTYTPNDPIMPINESRINRNGTVGGQFTRCDTRRPGSERSNEPGNLSRGTLEAG